jgi:hypothetical protein
MEKIKVIRVLITILTILVSNAVYALDAEFKNNLVDIELNKTSDSSYNVNLYTSKQYSEPIKVVKKSDLSYYILLPETNSSAKTISANSPDIKSVNTQLFPYVGADVKNGYTKININTTKPINFIASAKVNKNQRISQVQKTRFKKKIFKKSSKNQRLTL